MDVVRFLQTSVTGKALFVGALVLTLLIPLAMVERLIAERSLRYEGARADVARIWGRRQTIGGPILIVPVRLTSGGDSVADSEFYILPDQLDIASDAKVQALARGIYRVPVYDARVHITGRFTLPAGFPRSDAVEFLWDEAQIALPISDPRSIREPVRFTAGGANALFRPGGTRVAGFGPQLAASFADLGLGPPSVPFEFSIDVALGGSDWLGFLPLGAATHVSATADWPSPSFRGAYLPEQRSVTDTGFSATWRVLDIGRAFPSRWSRSDPHITTSGDAIEFGAALIDPIGVHEATLRAAKYGVLLIGLCFAAYFAFELLAGLRLHALQYLMIGMANCVFYLLLLALAEQIGFGYAYLASAGASAALITLYSVAALRSVPRALPIGALLAALYSYLYVTLRAEDYALLLGALGTFATLAAIMYFTRHVDWHAVRIGAGETTFGAGAPFDEDPQEGV
jgi:inner membrane protein